MPADHSRKSTGNRTVGVLEAAEKPIWEVAENLVRAIPEEVLDSVPTDGAAQHDHFLYAAPKRD